MKSYLLNKKYIVPGFLVKLCLSWMICLAAITLLGISLSIHGHLFPDAPNVNLLDLLPKPFTVLAVVIGTYTGLGAIFLWGVMWVYWIAVERGSLGARLGWFLMLLFGLYYGSLVYSFVVWRNALERK